MLAGRVVGRDGIGGGTGDRSGAAARVMDAICSYLPPHSRPAGSARVIREFTRVLARQPPL